MFGRFKRKRNYEPSVPTDFVHSVAQVHSVLLLSDIQLAEEYVGDTSVSRIAMRELLRRYDHYDITAQLFIDEVAALIHIGEVS